MMKKNQEALDEKTMMTMEDKEAYIRYKNEVVLVILE